jgi:hypothetical protein
MNNVKARRPLLVLAVVALVAGMWGGLVRMGWQVPPLRPTLVLQHGPLMVCAFLGTLIGLERAVALGRGWGFASPLLCGLGGILAIAGTAGAAPQWLFVAGGALLVAMFAGFVARQRSVSMYVMLLGAVLWTVGNVLWVVGRPLHEVSLWWVGFIVMTILGERWGFSRLVSRTRESAGLFGLGIGVCLAGLAGAGIHRLFGTLVLGLGLMLLANWFLLYDISRRNLYQGGLPRYVAVAVQTGALWLGIGGLLMAFFGEHPAGVRYDAFLHAVFVGFAFSMIFGHAPLIFPSVLKLPLEYTGSLYAPLVLLHLSLVGRAAGDLAGQTDVRAAGGMLNAVAILAFFGVVAVTAFRGRAGGRS